jgi:hypothetical protein
MYNGGIASKRPPMRNRTKYDDPTYRSRRSHTLRKIKIEATIRISSQKI